MKKSPYSLNLLALVELTWVPLNTLPSVIRMGQYSVSPEGQFDTAQRGQYHFEHLGASDITEVSLGGRNKQTTSRHRAISVGYQDGQWKERLLVSAAQPGKYQPTLIHLLVYIDVDCKLPAMGEQFLLCVGNLSEFCAFKRPLTQSQTLS